MRAAILILSESILLLVNLGRQMDPPCGIPACSCASFQQQPESQQCLKAPKSFGFVFRYGRRRANILNTFAGVYTKDLVDGDTTIRLSLSQDQLDSVYSKMIEVDLFNLPTHWSESEIRSVRCWKQFGYDVRGHGVTKQIRSFPCEGSYKEKARLLEQLDRFIIRLIQSKREYKELPDPRSGYL